PDPHADEGRHQFVYALYPHAGSWRQAETVRRGRELNEPLFAMVAAPHDGPLGAAHAFVRVEPEHVMLSALKRAEDEDALIVRLYEYVGQNAVARISLPPGATRAVTTNLLEQGGSELTIEAGAVVAPMSPYEIKTIKVFFA